LCSNYYTGVVITTQRHHTADVSEFQPPHSTTKISAAASLPPPTPPPPRHPHRRRRRPRLVRGTWTSGKDGCKPQRAEVCVSGRRRRRRRCVSSVKRDLVYRHTRPTRAQTTAVTAVTAVSRQELLCWYVCGNVKRDLVYKHKRPKETYPSVCRLGFLRVFCSIRILSSPTIPGII
jgi:hypothetical protein